ncbi:MAG: acetyl-CoA C-acyltransferase [Candidatus Lokiarchaeota archaeon]|nr:acetyl-CoA C-acyltransferase [Candidatus Lokiarchaeota archaeon]MBD3338288.1 acetyl-CoA C-acyltransferase [Candidatus Lokiarchaeota archaeon]
MNDKDIVICYAKRTAIGTFGGSLLPYNASKLLSFCIRDCINTTGIDPSIISDIKSGCCMEPQEEMNVARVASLLADIPIEVPAMTINRVCTSAMEAVRAGMADIQLGYADVVLAGGTESMSNVSYYIPSARWGARLRNKEMKCGVMEGLHAGSKVFGDGYIMGMTAEYVAEKYNITREMQDKAALASQNNAEKATTSGRFKDEIIPVEVKTRRKTYIFDKDEHFRPGLTMEDLQKLPPVFKKDGTVTAGNSSGINDGACITLLTTMEKAQELGLTPLVKIKTISMIGNDPRLMGMGPMYSAPLALKQANMKYEDLGLVECNEAFASQYVAVGQELNWNFEKTNVNGSGIGLGHPVGCTGARIIVSLIHEMKKRNVSYGLATLCGGGGVSEATIVENI